MIALYAIASVLAYFVWTTIHECSHYLAARYLFRAKLVRMRLYPHVDPQAGFRFGAVEYAYSEDPLIPSYHAIVSFAPRIPNLLAAVALPAANLAEPLSPAFMLITIFVGAGIVDLCYGSIGYSTYSDLRKGASSLNRSPWLFRITGFLVAVLSVTAWVCGVIF